MINDSLENICKQAWSEGQRIDLSGISYGPPHWKGDFVDKASSYHCFLAGLVYTQRLTKILDMGTHFGGSIMSMAKGIDSSNIEKSCLVTADITYLNEEGFKKFPYIKRIRGDILDRRVVRKILRIFKSEVDLIYIDTDHKYAHVKSAIAIYANRLKPKYVILDDINLNNSMISLWRELKSEFGDRAFDVSEMGIRSKEAGFGVIAWNNEFKKRWKLIEILYANSYILKQSLKRRIKKLFGIGN